MVFIAGLFSVAYPEEGVENDTTLAYRQLFDWLALGQHAIVVTRAEQTFEAMRAIFANDENIVQATASTIVNDGLLQSHWHQEYMAAAAVLSGEVREIVNNAQLSAADKRRLLTHALRSLEFEV